MLTNKNEIPKFHKNSISDDSNINDIYFSDEHYQKNKTNKKEMK